MGVRRNAALAVSTVSAIAALAPHSASASQVTWSFRGEITRVDDTDGFLEGQIQAGDAYSGSFTFDTNTPDANPDDPRRGLYNNAVTSVEGDVAGRVFVPRAGTPANIVVFNDLFGDDRYHANGGVSFLDLSMTFSLNLIDHDQTALSSDLLPRDPPEITAFSNRQFALRGTGSPRVDIIGEIAFLAPEPTSLALLAGGILCALRRRPA